MYKILFRGKKREFHRRDEYGEWIYGDIMQNDAGTAIYSNGKFLGAVFPETVEMYTGRKDENGNMIFAKMEETE